MAVHTLNEQKNLLQQVSVRRWFGQFSVVIESIEVINDSCKLPAYKLQASYHPSVQPGSELLHPWAVILALELFLGEQSPLRLALACRDP